MKRFLVLLALAAGCESTVAPPLDGDIYVLLSIDGKAIPAPFAPNPNYNGTILADTIAFAANGTGQRRSRYQNDPEPTQYSSTENFTYTRNGNRVEVWFVCPDGASCIAGPHLTGTVASDGITFDQSVVSRFPLVFAKVERLE